MDSCNRLQCIPCEEVLGCDLEFEFLLVSRFREECAFPLECDCVANSHCVVLVDCLAVRLSSHDTGRDTPPLFAPLHGLDEARQASIDVLAVGFIAHIAPCLIFCDLIPTIEEYVRFDLHLGKSGFHLGRPPVSLP